MEPAPHVVLPVFEPRTSVYCPVRLVVPETVRLPIVPVICAAGILVRLAAENAGDAENVGVALPEVKFPKTVLADWLMSARFAAPEVTLTGLVKITPGVAMLWIALSALVPCAEVAYAVAAVVAAVPKPSAVRWVAAADPLYPQVVPASIEVTPPIAKPFTDEDVICLFERVSSPSKVAKSASVSAVLNCAVVPVMPTMEVWFPVFVPDRFAPVILPDAAT